MKDTDMASSSPLLSVRHLRVEIPTRHGPLVALDDVSFDADRLQGQSVCIDEAYVDRRLQALSQDDDLSRFIL